MTWLAPNDTRGHGSHLEGLTEDEFAELGDKAIDVITAFAYHDIKPEGSEGDGLDDAAKQYLLKSTVAHEVQTEYADKKFVIAGRNRFQQQLLNPEIHLDPVFGITHAQKYNKPHEIYSFKRLEDWDDDRSVGKDDLFKYITQHALNATDTDLEEHV